MRTSLQHTEDRTSAENLKSLLDKRIRPGTYTPESLLRGCRRTSRELEVSVLIPCASHSDVVDVVCPRRERDSGCGQGINVAQERDRRGSGQRASSIHPSGDRTLISTRDVTSPRASISARARGLWRLPPIDSSSVSASTLLSLALSYSATPRAPVVTRARPVLALAAILLSAGLALSRPPLPAGAVCYAHLICLRLSRSLGQCNAGSLCHSVAATTCSIIASFQPLLRRLALTVSNLQCFSALNRKHRRKIALGGLCLYVTNAPKCYLNVLTKALAAPR